MEHEDIINKLRSKFITPDRWGNQPRVVFWIDAEGEFRDTIKEFDFRDIKCLVFDGFNGFRIK